jgi:hypothetical protein
MGRWAQANRRGGGGAALAGLQPPPAPVLAEDAGALKSFAQGSPDDGGECRLYYSATLGGPYDLYSAVAWAQTYEWADVSSLDPGFYAATELGNGVAYSGLSAFSNEFEVE